MTKDKLTDYDATASGNLDVGGVSVAEGMLPSGVNNAIREQMSHLADFASGTSGVDVLKLQDDTDTNSIKLQAPASVTATTTFTLPDGDGTADQVLKTDGSGQLGFADRHANPSLIINGAMQVAQRGTSSTTNGYGSVDRFENSYSGGTVTGSQESLTSSDAPYALGFRNYFRQTNTATTSGAADYRQLIQKIESQNIAKSGWNYTSTSSYITVSCWVRSSVAGKYGFYLLTFDSPNYQFAFTETLVADTWTKVTKTIPGNSNLVFNNDNGVGVGFQPVPWFGTDYTDSTATMDSWVAQDTAKYLPDDIVNWAGTSGATFDLTGVKLEVGSTATDFVHRSYGEELALCQRYYEEWGGELGYQPFGYLEGTGTVGFCVLQFTEKRDAPTVTVSDPAHFHSVRSSIPFTAMSFSQPVTTHVICTISRSSNNWASGEIFSWRANNSTAARIYFNAEL